MIDFMYTHPDGRRERIRQVAETMNKRKAEAEERDILRRLDAGTYGGKEVAKTVPTVAESVDISVENFAAAPNKPSEVAKTVPTVAEFGEIFIECYAAVENKPSEVKSKSDILRLYINPLLGKKRLDEVGALEIGRLTGELRKCELAPKTIRNILAVLSRMMWYAVETEQIDHKPRIRFPKCPEPDFDYLTFEETDLLLAAAKEKAPDWYGPLFVTIRTGLRRGELFELRWGDVQFKGGAPHIRIARSISKGQVVTTKTNRPRIVFLTPATVEYLQSLRQLHTGLMFCTRDGKHVAQNTSDSNLRRVCRLAGLREIGWHVLRHSYASHLVMKGVPLKVIQDQLGHTTMQMTLRYAHLAPDSLSSAVAVLDDPKVAWSWQRNVNAAK
jgi:integrase